MTDEEFLQQHCNTDIRKLIDRDRRGEWNSKFEVMERVESGRQRRTVRRLRIRNSRPPSIRSAVTEPRSIVFRGRRSLGVTELRSTVVDTQIGELRKSTMNEDGTVRDCPSQVEKRNSGVWNERTRHC